MSEPVSGLEIQKEAIYRSLLVQFSRIEAVLSDEMKTELDGLLWVLAGKIAGGVSKAAYQ